jgi:signal peptide peptidase SppA
MKSTIRSPALPSLVNAFQQEGWAITPTMHERIQQIIQDRAQGLKPDLSVLEAQISGQTYGTESGGDLSEWNQVAVISLHGPIISRAGIMERISGATSPQDFATRVRSAANDPRVMTIVLDLDSPGGTISGTSIAAEAVSYAAGQKKVIACVNDSAYSAALWIAAQATEIVIPKAGGIGSIGVIMTHFDLSGLYAKEGIQPTVIRSVDLKAVPQPTEPMTGKALEQTQKRVAAYHEQFVQAVAAGRGVTLEKANAWATGETWLGEEAVAMGLADRIGTLNGVLAELTGQATPPPDPEEDPDEDDDVTVEIEIDPDDDDGPAEDGASQTPTPTAAADVPTAASSSTEPPPAAPTPTGTEPAASTGGTPMNIKDITAKLAAGQALTTEERSFLTTHLDAQQPAAAAPVDLSGLSPEVRALIETSQQTASAAQAQAERASADAAKAQQEAATERDIRLKREFEDKALALGQPADFGATLRSASEKLSAEEYGAFTEKLSAAHAQTKLFEAIGSASPNTASASSQTSAQAVEDEAQKLIKGGMSVDQAYAEATKGAHGQAYADDIRSNAPRT